MNMDYVEKFINEYFSPQVEEDMRGMKVVYKSKTSMDDGVVWFERAKTGWVKKPIKQNHFIIVDADMGGVLEHLNKYYNLTEEHYPHVRKVIIQMSIDVIDKYFTKE
jgi:hypothetical protein